MQQQADQRPSGSGGTDEMARIVELLTSLLLFSSSTALGAPQTTAATKLPTGLAGYTLGMQVPEADNNRTCPPSMEQRSEEFLDVDCLLTPETHQLWSISVLYGPASQEQTSFDALVKAREGKYGHARRARSQTACCPHCWGIGGDDITFRCAIWEDSKIKMILVEKTIQRLSSHWNLELESKHLSILNGKEERSMESAAKKKEAQKAHDLLKDE